MSLKHIKHYQSQEYKEYVFEQKWATILNKLEKCKLVAKLKYTQGLPDDVNKNIVKTIDFLHETFQPPIEPIQPWIVSEKEFNAEKNREEQEEYRRLWVDSKDPEWK